FRGAARAASAVGRAGLVGAHPHLGAAILRTDGQAPQAHTGHPRNGCGARADRDVGRTLRAGGTVAVAPPRPLRLARGTVHAWVYRRLRTDVPARAAHGGDAGEGAPRRPWRCGMSVGRYSHRNPLSGQGEGIRRNGPGGGFGGPLFSLLAGAFVRLSAARA